MLFKLTEEKAPKIWTKKKIANWTGKLCQSGYGLNCFETPILTKQSVIPAKLHCGLMQMSQIKAVLEK